MVELIAKQVTEIITNCILKNAAAAKGVKVEAYKQKHFDKKDAQLVFKLVSFEDVGYVLYLDYKPKKELTFNQVLDVLIDFKGYKSYATPFISSALNRFAAQHTIPLNEIRVIAMLSSVNEVEMWVCSNAGYIKQIGIGDLIDEQDMGSILG